MLLEPVADGQQVALRRQTEHIQLFLHCMQDLRAVSTAERIGREIAVASAPMHVLKAAAGVVRHVNAEIFLIFRVPERGDLVHGDLAVDERLFQLVADQDVQAVGQLVRVAADKARLRDIRRLVKLPLGHVGKGVAGDLAQLWVDEMDERLAPADEVLIEARDALVHGVRHGIGGVLAVELLRLVLHEQRVSALVERGEDVGDEIFLVVMRGDAHIVRAEVGRERMLRRHEHQRGAAQALQLQQIL